MFPNDEETEYKVTNIIPYKTGQLTISQYNRILNDLYNNFTLPHCKEYGLVAKLSEFEITLEKYISKESSSLLHTFSIAANKSTGTSHPLDKARWFKFVINVFNDGSDLPTDILNRWLVEVEDWSENMAFELIIEFEQAISLLKAYKKTL